MTFSPPMSPPPLQLALNPSVRLKQQQQHGNVFAPACEANANMSSLSHQPIVLRPVPTSHNAAARRLSRTTNNLRTQTLSEEDSKTGVSQTSTETSTTLVSTTTTPTLFVSPASSFTRTTTTMTSSYAGASSITRSKTDDLDRYISQLEASAPSSTLSVRETKKYTRRRYTDSRHPTTELPDVSSEDVPPPKMVVRKRYD